MTNTYTMSINFYEANLNGDFSFSDACGYKVNGTSIEDVKSKFNDIIWEAIEIERWDRQRVLMVQTITQNGNFVDSDEAVINIEKVVHTNKPSVYIAWDKMQRTPDIFSVDRENSKWELEF